MSNELTNRHILHEEHKYYARAGLELVLGASLFFAVFWQVFTHASTDYRTDKLEMLRSEIIESHKPEVTTGNKENKNTPETETNDVTGGIVFTPDGEKKDIDRIIGENNEISFSDIPFANRVLDEFIYALICDDWRRLAECWIAIESNKMSHDYFAIVVFMFTAILSLGTLRLYVGTHYIDEDDSFQKAIVSSGTTGSLRFEAVLRPILYLTTILVLALLDTGYITWLCGVFVAQVAVLLLYLWLFWKPLSDDKDKYSSGLIRFNDAAYILVVGLFVFFQWKFRTSDSGQGHLMADYGSIMLFACVVFIFAMAVEIKVSFGQSIGSVFCKWKNYTLKNEPKSRDFLLWNFVKVSPKKPSKNSRGNFIVQLTIREKENK